MNKHALLKALTSAGVAASLVVGTDAVHQENETDTAEASETESQNYNYKGDTGHGTAVSSSILILKKLWKQTVI